jgi:hypothetical protein
LLVTALACASCAQKPVRRPGIYCGPLTICSLENLDFANVPAVPDLKTVPRLSGSPREFQVQLSAEARALGITPGTLGLAHLTAVYRDNPQSTTTEFMSGGTAQGADPDSLVFTSDEELRTGLYQFYIRRGRDVVLLGCPFIVVGTRSDYDPLRKPASPPS